MRMYIDRATTWWDESRQFEIPAGEPVNTVPIDEVPWADRWDLKDGIAGYLRQGRRFMPVKIRTWYAIVDKDWLTHKEPQPPGLKFGDKTRARVAAREK